MRSVP